MKSGRICPNSTVVLLKLLSLTPTFLRTSAVSSAPNFRIRLGLHGYISWVKSVSHVESFKAVKAPKTEDETSSGLYRCGSILLKKVGGRGKGSDVVEYPLLRQRVEKAIDWSASRVVQMRRIVLAQS